MSSPPLLEVQSISLSFQGVQALSDVSFSVRHGEVLGIIGPNGAGKSSLLNVINGIYRPDSGSVRFQGHALSGASPRRAAELGVARTFQNLALFRGMTVQENVLSGRNLHLRATIFEHALRLPRAVRETQKERERVDSILELLRITQHRDTTVGKLPYGLQKRVELARALAAEPSLLLLDEPMAGMNFDEKVEFCHFILEVNDSLATTLVLIEHDMSVVMGISDRVVVLDHGEKIAENTPDQIRQDQRVIDAYLGLANERAA